jgi:hypothetical protein
MVQDALIMPL